MTDLTTPELSRSIMMAFLALYGNTTSSVEIHGLETEEITVHLFFPEQPARTFVAETVSDDDGFLHFMLDDCTVQVLVPYGES